MSASGYLFSNNTTYEAQLPIVIWESGSGQYYHTNSIKVDHLIADNVSAINNLNVQGPITASGNISSSGIIVASGFAISSADVASISFGNIPTSDPGVAGKLYNIEGNLKISLG